MALKLQHWGLATPFRGGEFCLSIAYSQCADTTAAHSVVSPAPPPHPPHDTIILDNLVWRVSELEKHHHAINVADIALRIYQMDVQLEVHAKLNELFGERLEKAV